MKMMKEFAMATLVAGGVCAANAKEAFYRANFK